MTNNKLTDMIMWITGKGYDVELAGNRNGFRLVITSRSLMLGYESISMGDMSSAEVCCQEAIDFIKQQNK